MVKDAVVDNFQRCNDYTDEAYTMEDNDSIILCRNAFALNPDQTTNKLGLEKENGALPDDFLSLTRSSSMRCNIPTSFPAM